MQNTNNELVSVIVPVYKVEPYLDRCVASILAQTYPNLEVILVDDGSPDNCPALCDAWAQRDARIRVIHKKNGGLSDARNVGLDAASGAYISFVDSDDYIAENFIETLYDLLHEYHTDISAVHWKLVYADAPEVPAPLSSRNVTLFQGADAIRELFTEDTYACYAWNKLCKRELFDTIRFPVGRIMEDLGIAHKILFDAGQIVYSDEPLYYYYQRDGSILHTDCIKFFQDRLAMVTERYLFLEKLYPDMLENDAYFVDMALNDYPILYRSGRDGGVVQRADAVVGALLFECLEAEVPDVLGTFGRALQERRVAQVGGDVRLHETRDVDFLAPKPVDKGFVQFHRMLFKMRLKLSYLGATKVCYFYHNTEIFGVFS